MFIRITSLCLLASVAIARQNIELEAPFEVNWKSEFAEGFESNIDDLLQKLQTLVDNAVTFAHHELDVAERAVNRTALKVETEAHKALNGLQKKFASEIDALKEKAKAKGVNIDSCLGQDEADLVNLPTVAANDVVKCVQGYVNTVFRDVNDVLSKIQKVVDDVTEIKKEVKACGSGAKSVACLAKLSLKVTKDIVSAPLQITNDVKNVVATITGILPEMEKCGVNTVADCTTKGGVLVAKITACVAGKLKN